MIVSVITPTYQRGHSIEKTLNSIKNQTYPHVEHIVVDGGSSDKTKKLLEVYEKEYNLKWISEKDNGHPEACNKGFAISTGEIIGFCNADDTYKENTIERVVDIFKNKEVDLVFGDSIVHNYQNNKEYLEKKFHDESMCLKDFLSGKKFFPQQSLFYRRKLLEEVGGFDIDLKFSSQYDLWIRILKLGASAFYCKEVFSIVGDYGDRNSVEKAVESQKEWMTVIRKHGGVVATYRKLEYLSAKHRNIATLCKKMLPRRFINFLKNLGK